MRQNRRPAGSPAGGQFTPESRVEDDPASVLGPLDTAPVKPDDGPVFDESAVLDSDTLAEALRDGAYMVEAREERRRLDELLDSLDAEQRQCIQKQARSYEAGPFAAVLLLPIDPADAALKAIEAAKSRHLWGTPGKEMSVYAALLARCEARDPTSKTGRSLLTKVKAAYLADLAAEKQARAQPRSSRVPTAPLPTRSRVPTRPLGSLPPEPSESTSDN